MKPASGILREWSISYNIAGMHTKLFYSVKFINRISKEVITCDISSLESIGYVVIGLQSNQHVTCHSPIGIVHTRLAENL